MPIQRTLTIIKPDAFGAAKAGKIIALLEEKGFRVKSARVLHLTQQQLHTFLNKLTSAIGADQIGLTSSALSTAATVFEVLAGVLLTLFTLIFFLYGGRNIWQYVTKIFPVGVRGRVREAGHAGYGSLIGYVRATFLVALTDAAGVGTGLAIMGIPLALPLSCPARLRARSWVVG